MARDVKRCPAQDTLVGEYVGQHFAEQRDGGDRVRLERFDGGILRGVLAGSISRYGGTVKIGGAARART